MSACPPPRRRSPALEIIGVRLIGEDLCLGCLTHISIGRSGQLAQSNPTIRVSLAPP